MELLKTLIISLEDQDENDSSLGSRIFNLTDTIIKRNFRNKGNVKIVLCAGGSEIGNLYQQTSGSV